MERWKCLPLERMLLFMTFTNTSSQQRPVNQEKRPLWRNRDFLLLWSGQIVSVLGTNISGLALPLLALALTHSPAQAGLLTATRQLPYLLFSLPAGALIDRWNRKAVMIRCDIVRWLALGSVPLAFFLHHLTLAQLYLVAFIEGTGYVLFSLAQIAALPQVVDEEHLPRAYALDTTSEYAGSLLGPGFGGLIIGLAPLVALGASFAYLADSISYLVSVLTLSLIRISFQTERKAEQRRSLLHEMAEGLRFLWGQQRLRIMVLLTTAVNFLLSPVTLIVIVLAQGTLRLDVPTLGLVISAGGIGGVIGGVIAPWIRTRLRFGQIIIGSVFLWAAASLLLALAPSAALLIVGIGIQSFLWPLYGVTLVSYRLSLTPDELQGRVNSAFRFLSYCSEPLGAAIGGLLLVPSGPRAVLGIIALGLTISAITVSLSSLRKA